METFIDYFSTIPSLHRALILAGGIALFWILESFRPLFIFDYHKWKHARINLFFTFTTIIVNFAMAFLLLTAAEWTQKTQFGLLAILPENIWLQLTIGLLFLDFIGAYLAHFVQHKVPFLWKFHLIHHSDAFIDTTTANRHHPGESVIRFLFTIMAVILIGTPMWMVFLYQSLSVIFSQFNHANITLPKPIDDILKMVIVTPDMHKVHHHYKLPHTDSNYGNIFSIWDWIFGTITKIGRSDLKYGVDTHMDEKHHGNIKNLLTIPFKRKDYEVKKKL